MHWLLCLGFYLKCSVIWILLFPCTEQVYFVSIWVANSRTIIIAKCMGTIPLPHARSKTIISSLLMDVKKHQILIDDETCTVNIYIYNVAALNTRHICLINKGCKIYCQWISTNKKIYFSIGNLCSHQLFFEISSCNKY